MDRKRLDQYRALQKEIPKLKNKIKNLEERLSKVPIVSDKIMKSSDSFPYLIEHLKVEAEEPKAATEIKKQIMINEKRLVDAEREKTIIEVFVKNIPDSTDRQIFEMIFLQGKKHWEVADELGYSRSRITQKISEKLKD